MKANNKCKTKAWQEAEIDGRDVAVPRCEEKLMLKQAKVTLVRWRLGRSVGIDQETVHDVGPGVDPDLFHGSHLAAAG